MACPVCRDRNTVAIQLTLRERQVTMHSCSRCDSRWWDNEGTRLRLPEVLQLASR